MKRNLWHGKLQKIYNSLAEWRAYSKMYNLAARLGFRSAKAAWEANPIIQGSINPEDFGLRTSRTVKKVL